MMYCRLVSPCCTALLMLPLTSVRSVRSKDLPEFARGRGEAGAGLIALRVSTFASELFLLGRGDMAAASDGV